ncbi:Voltage-dependent calcium channel subunit alpha-2/delta-3 [Tupaia chinensis]|uniref:Voltage-dependent calcium channel subunit alpha-2/delta-3 n=1 Tax=Tupaia chinensis TaxID=246437 RepID=L9L5I7_TUPCH|nr:Voltage-dependent calcium channel subunit alpha-2/delta-3 [Tupaia chinensis]
MPCWRGLAPGPRPPAHTWYHSVPGAAQLPRPPEVPRALPPALFRAGNDPLTRTNFRNPVVSELGYFPSNNGFWSGAISRWLVDCAESSGPEGKPFVSGIHSRDLSISGAGTPFTAFYPAIVNGVYWSESLNKVFVDNFDRDPSLIWQYFGSAKGFFRQYPGIKWEPDENGVIAFDCRNRKWYIQAATSPKDVVILVDVSGSMKGLRLTIAKQTVSSILDTLGDDDFFNIIAYNEELHYVEPCLNGTLVQADRTNKEHFREHLDKLFAKGIGMLDIALNEAFNILSDFNHTGQGSICSQAIMLITDGAVDTYDTIFAKYNWPERKVSRYQHYPCSGVHENLYCNLQMIHKAPCVDNLIMTNGFSAV